MNFALFLKSSEIIFSFQWKKEYDYRSTAVNKIVIIKNCFKIDKAIENPFPYILVVVVINQ